MCWHRRLAALARHFLSRMMRSAVGMQAASVSWLEEHTLSSLFPG